jgi:hypothetical protein
MGTLCSSLPIALQFRLDPHCGDGLPMTVRGGGVPRKPWLMKFDGSTWKLFGEVISASGS